LHITFKCGCAVFEIREWTETNTDMLTAIFHTPPGVK